MMNSISSKGKVLGGGLFQSTLPPPGSPFATPHPPYSMIIWAAIKYSRCCRSARTLCAASRFAHPCFFLHPLGTLWWQWGIFPRGGWLNCPRMDGNRPAGGLSTNTYHWSLGIAISNRIDRYYISIAGWTYLIHLLVELMTTHTHFVLQSK